MRATGGSATVAAMDEIVLEVALRAGLSREQAARAVAAVLLSLSARLPSPLFGQIGSVIRTPAPASRD